jgi:beta-galactosidase
MNRQGKITGLAAALLIAAQLLMAQSPVRVELDFNKGWKFLLGNDSLAIKPGYNDSKWRMLSLPHDWSIESNFIKDAPATNQGGSLPGGMGWYRKTFTIPVSDKNKIIRIAFDGVYKNSEVWINGHYLGKRPNGYVNFSYDLTKYLQLGKPNVIAVKVDNSLQPDSRWYTGSGIYRDVKLIKTNRISIKENGVYITTEVNNKSIANINIQILVTDPDATAASFEVKQEILDANGKPVPDRNFHSNVRMNLQGPETEHLITTGIDNPVLWDVSNPYLYTLRTRLYVKGVLVDEVMTRFGVRSFRFDATNGFFLNDQALKIKGVCMHHDLGALGAAYNNAAGKRQLTILKKMGCNAIRFSHNPPSSALLDLCDEMGFLVIDEAFDMWKKKKNKYDYHLYFEEWHEKDLTAMIVRDRNHPSVFMWSIGNEIREQFDSSGIVITKELVGLAKQLDPTRPVISAMTETNPKYNYIAKAGALDVFGFNYKDFDYDSLPVRFPGQKFLATETASSLVTRGVYQFPSDSVRTWPPDYKHQDSFDGGNPDYTAPAYDNTKAYWGGLHEKTWLAVKNRPFIAGGFVWSGFDYIGEPLPYPKFPARSSYFGIADLAGFPKDIYYMYQSEWTDKPVLHVFPHWTWKQGDTVDVWTYYSQADEVELFVNNKSAGKRSKTDSTLHVMWRVPYEPGAIKVISRKNEKTVLTKEIKTAGKPYRIELTADKKSLKADGRDLSFVTVKVLDARGNIVPDAGHLVRFSVSGSGTLAGTDNGYQADTLSLKSNQRTCWKGMALVIVQSTEKKGNITLKADSAGLLPAVISLKTGE